MPIPKLFGLDWEDYRELARRLNQLNRLDRAYDADYYRVLRARFVGWSDGVHDHAGLAYTPAERGDIFDKVQSLTLPMRDAYLKHHADARITRKHQFDFLSFS